MPPQTLPIEHSAPLTIALVANTAWNLWNFRRGIIEALLADGHRVVLLAPDGPARPALEATGAQFIALQRLRRSGLNPLQDLALTRELARHYRREGVAAALHYTIKPVIFGSFAARRTGVRSINTLTGLGYTFLAGGVTAWIVRRLYQRALRGSTRVFFHNPDDRDLFLQAGLVGAEQSGVVPGSGVRVADFPLVPYAQAEAGHFLFVGRLLADKGIREYVAAARLVRRERPDLVFEVLGPLDGENPTGISAAELEGWIGEGVIRYAGATTDVRPHLARASVVVLPSYREGCPRVLLEAGATGRALIGADVAGVREVVLPGVNGWLVPARDAEALAAACLAAADPAADLPGLGGRSRELVLSVFAEERVIAHYRAVLA